MWGGLRLNLQTNSIITAVMSKKTNQPVFLSLYLSNTLSVFVSAWPMAVGPPVWPHLSSPLSVWPYCQTLSSCLSRCTCPSLHLSDLPICPCLIYLPTCFCTCLPLYPFTSLLFSPTCLSVPVTAWLFPCRSLHVYLFLYLSVWPTCLPVCVCERDRETW